MRAKNQITGKENRLVRRLDQLPSLAWLKPLYAATGQGIFSGPEVLSAAHMRHIEPFFPRPGGLARVDDRRVISRIIMSLTDGFWAGQGGVPERLVIDSTHLKAPRTAQPDAEGGALRIDRTKGALNSTHHAVCDGQPIGRVAAH